MWQRNGYLAPVLLIVLAALGHLEIIKTARHRQTLVKPSPQCPQGSPQAVHVTPSHRKSRFLCYSADATPFPDLSRCFPNPKIRKSRGDALGDVIGAISTSHVSGPVHSLLSNCTSGQATRIHAGCHVYTYLHIDLYSFIYINIYIYVYTVYTYIYTYLYGL